MVENKEAVFYQDKAWGGLAFWANEAGTTITRSSSMRRILCRAAVQERSAVLKAVHQGSGVGNRQGARSVRLSRDGEAGATRRCGERTSAWSGMRRRADCLLRMRSPSRAQQTGPTLRLPDAYSPETRQIRIERAAVRPFRLRAGYGASNNCRHSRSSMGKSLLAPRPQPPCPGRCPSAIGSRLSFDQGQAVAWIPKPLKNRRLTAPAR
jgi:hypothetical protein